MKKKLFPFCTALAALILEILPYGAVCMFANPEGEPWRHTYSYFDLTPFGYANFAPFLTALLTCVIVLLAALSFAVKKPPRRAIGVLSAIAVPLSLAPLLFGTAYFTPVAALISTALTATAAMSFAK